MMSESNYSQFTYFFEQFIVQKVCEYDYFVVILQCISKNNNSWNTILCKIWF
jgi:hypothetical protein